MQHTLQTTEARFGDSKAFAGLDTLATIQAANARREVLTTLAFAAVAFVAAFAAVLIIGA